MRHFVYELAYPLTGVTFYVGITKNAYERLKFHMNNRDRSNLAKKAVVQSLKDDGLAPVMRILESVDSLEIAQEREKYWINYYAAQDLPLTNIALVPPKNVNTLPLAVNGLYSVRDVLRLLNISRTTLYKLMDEGTIVPTDKLPHHKKHGKVQFRESDVNKLLKKDPANSAA